MNNSYHYSRQEAVQHAVNCIKQNNDEREKLPDYVQTVVVKDSKGLEKVLLLPKALDLDRPKRSRTAFSKWQLDALEATFCTHPYLVGEQRTSLARKLGLSETQIKVWYQNRRTKQRKEAPSSSLSLINNHEEPSPRKAETQTPTSQPSNFSPNVPLINNDANSWAPSSTYNQNSASNLRSDRATEFFNQAFHYRTNIYHQFIQSYGAGIGSSILPTASIQPHSSGALGATTTNDCHHQHRIF